MVFLMILKKIFWHGGKSNLSKYQVLSHVARNVIAIHVSFIASESAFGTGACVHDHCHVS